MFLFSGNSSVGNLLMWKLFWSTFKLRTKTHQVERCRERCAVLGPGGRVQQPALPWHGDDGGGLAPAGGGGVVLDGEAEGAPAAAGGGLHQVQSGHLRGKEKNNSIKLSWKGRRWQETPLHDKKIAFDFCSFFICLFSFLFAQKWTHKTASARADRFDFSKR